MPRKLCSADLAKRHRRRVVYSDLMALDDRTLKDIGITRGRILALAISAASDDAAAGHDRSRAPRMPAVPPPSTNDNWSAPRAGRRRAR
ncbi:MAG: DUF1127 domain-containing protein [Alphaproteobacteria bacterium]|nr:DUF1127 domain-containing protein [Alphaproteobacteria bacterium]